MFTKQSGQIKNAIMNMGGDNSSATQIVDAVANCSQALVHSGPVAFDMPPATVLPDLGGGYLPGGGYGKSGGGTPGITEIFVQATPWTQIPFDPMPYPVFPEWKMIPYLEEPAVSVSGPVQLGPITSPALTGGSANIIYLYVRGEAEIEDDLDVGGDATISGKTATDRLRVRYGSDLGGTVTTTGTVKNLGRVYNNTSYNGDTYTSGDATFDGTVTINGPVTIEGNRVVLTKKTFVTLIENDPTSGLTITYETVFVATLDDAHEANAAVAFTTTVCG